MKGIFVGTKPTPYKVIIGARALTQVGSLIAKTAPDVQKVLIVSDSNVAPLYLEKVKKGIEISKMEVCEYVFEAGEKSKNIDSIAAMWGVMAENKFTRTDAVVALGGGVVTDMGGFAAATFLRGIKVFQVPTSLLAMVDAAIGGKTGIDLKEGKNLAGAFWQPTMVIEDTDCLKTLPDELFTEGFGEIIKHAFIMDTELYDLLREIADEGKVDKIREDDALLEKIVSMNVSDKVSVITEDALDNGLRQTLNYGHTVGHVIERNSNFSLAHGVCVAKGMGIMIDSCEAAGTLPSEEASKMRDLIKAYGLPVSDDITAKEAFDGVLNDKKKRGDNISVILVNKIGHAEIKKMTAEEFESFIGKGKAL